MHYVRGFENNFSTRTFPQTPPNQAPFHNSPIYYTNSIFVREIFQAPNPRNSRQESTPSSKKSDTLPEQSFAFWRTSFKAFKAWQRWKFFFCSLFRIGKHKNVYILINYIRGEREILNKFAFAWRETFKLKIHTRKIGFRSSRVFGASGLEWVRYLRRR